MACNNTLPFNINFSLPIHLNVLHTDFPALKLFTVGCDDRHRVCFDCIRQNVEDVMRKERKIAQCPMCPHAITHDEVKQLFPGDVDLIELSLEIQLKSTLANGNFIDCPTVDCKARFEKPDAPPPIASAASKKHQVVAAARVRVSNNTSHPLGCSLFFWWFCFVCFLFLFVFFGGCSLEDLGHLSRSSWLPPSSAIRADVRCIDGVITFFRPRATNASFASVRHAMKGGTSRTNVMKLHPSPNGGTVG